MYIIMFILVCETSCSACIQESNKEDFSESIWESLYNNEKYRGFNPKEINSVCLRKTVDSAEWILFDDYDLIQKWIGFLENLEIKKIDTIDLNNYAGGNPIAKFTTDSDVYFIKFFVFSKKQLIIDNYIYEFRSSVEFPFDETYDEGEQRHGVVTPWD